MSFAEMLSSLKQKVESSKLDGNAVYQFTLTGDNGGSFHVVVSDGKGEVKEGTADSADLTVLVSDKDFDKLVAGKLNPVMAYMTGKIKVQGDLSLAMKLQGFLGN